MKKKSLIGVIVVLVMVILSVGSVHGRQSEQDKLIKSTDWKKFSKNLVMALKSDNLGLQISAMQHIIHWNKYVKVGEAAPVLIKLYRQHENERVRQISLVTINAINNDWAKGIVKRDIAFEESAKIKKMMYAILRTKNERGPGESLQ